MQTLKRLITKQHRSRFHFFSNVRVTDLSSCEAGGLAEGLIAIYDRVVHDLGVGEDKA